jgi:hypothetical protein
MNSIAFLDEIQILVCKAEGIGAFCEATGRCVFGNPAQVSLGRDLKKQRQLGLPSVALLLPHPC